MNETEALEILRELVRRDTTSGRLESQAEAQSLAIDYATGVDGVRLTSRSTTGRPWALLETGSEPGVLFVCHMDTVPIGREEAWERGPWSAEVENGLLHGRGTVDMKAGLVAALHALRQSASMGIGASVLLTSDEEIGCRGASDCADALDLSPSLVIVPEATNNAVSLGHRGASWLKLTAHGRDAHGSAPHRGSNAIRLLGARAIARLDELPLSSDDYLGEETFNLGTISGGTAINIVPDSAYLTLDVRTVGGNDAVFEWASGLDPEIDVDVLLDLPAVRTKSIPAVLSGMENAPAVSYFTDASVLQQGFGGAPVVIWGPGDPGQMHALNEHLELDSWSQALRNFSHIVTQ